MNVRGKLTGIYILRYYQANLNKILAHQAVKGIKDVYPFAEDTLSGRFKWAKLFNWFTSTAEPMKSLWGQQFNKHSCIRPEHQLFMIQLASQICGHVRMR